MKRSQLSIFFILGLVIIFVIGFFYFIVTSQSEANMRNKANKLANDFSKFFATQMYDFSEHINSNEKVYLHHKRKYEMTRKIVLN